MGEKVDGEESRARPHEASCSCSKAKSAGEESKLSL